MVLDLTSGSIARRELIDVDENSPVSEAAKRMVEKNRGSVIVTRAGERVGILTERDILRKVVVKSLDPRSTKVKKVMTFPPVTIEQDRPLREAIDLMNRKGVRRMLVTEKGRIVGIFTTRDIVRRMRICVYCGKKIMSILDKYPHQVKGDSNAHAVRTTRNIKEPEPYVECQCGSRYHKKCSETIVHCVNCSRTLVTHVVYPEPSETFSG